MCNVITCAFPNSTVNMDKWISNFIPYLAVHVITYPMVLKLYHVIKGSLMAHTNTDLREMKHFRFKYDPTWVSVDLSCIWPYNQFLKPLCNVISRNYNWKCWRQNISYVFRPQSLYPRDMHAIFICGFSCGCYHLISPISARVTSLAHGQWYHCHNANESYQQIQIMDV